MSEIGRLFKTYQFEAFRLETLPQYKVPGEWENFQKYLKTGEVISDTGLIEYNSDAKEMIKKGRSHIRARVIPNPISNYFIFETKVGYKPQLELGFDFYFIKDSLFKNKSFANIQDFWLFDKKILLLMSYDDEGQFVSAEISDNENKIRDCIEIRNYFIDNGKPLSYIIDLING